MFSKTLPALLSIFLLFGSCNSNTSSKENDNQKSDEIMKESTSQMPTGSIILFVKIKTNLSEEELVRRAKERQPEFEALPGLIQKYYIKTATPGEYGGVYVWDSEESLQSYRSSSLAATIAQAYDAIEPPVIERVDILFPLRE